MLSKLVFLLALVSGLNAATTGDENPHLHITLRHGLKLSKLSGDPLIEAACKGVGDNEVDCTSTLKAATSDQKSDPTLLALYALRFVEVHAENIVSGIKNFSTVPDVAPLLSSALTDCSEQYNSIDDLIETAIDAVVRANYADAQKFITAAISSIDVCVSQLETSADEENKEDLKGQSVDMEKDLKKYNLLHKNLLRAAFNILTID